MKYIFTILPIFLFLCLSGQTTENKKCSSILDSITNRIVYIDVDTMAEFPGGRDSMMVFIENNLEWPEDGIDFEGRIIVSAIVETNGELSDINLLRGIYKSADEEAIKVIRKMPEWNTAKCNGKAVPVKVIIFVSFKVSY